MTSPISPLTQAVLLAAGKGTRMKDLTADLPKPMIPVNGIPILERILVGLVETGFHRFCIITGYREDVIRNHFGDGSRWKVSITYVHQEVQDGTGRVVELARHFVGESPFLLGYGDILVSSKTYADLQTLWNKGSADGLLAVKLGEEIQKGGTVIFDDQFCMLDLAEKASSDEIEKLRKRYGHFKPWYNAGIYVFTPAIFKYTTHLEKSPRGEYELTDALRAMIAAGLILRGYPISGDWADVRDPEVLGDLNRKFKSR